MDHNEVPILVRPYATIETNELFWKILRSAAMEPHTPIEGSEVYSLILLDGMTYQIWNHVLQPPSHNSKSQSSSLEWSQ